MFFSVLESLTLVLGLAYVLLQVKQSRWMWPVDILCCIAAVIVFAHQRLWASMGLNVYYLIMGFVGIVAWNKDAQKVENEQMRVRKMSRKTLVVSLLAMVVSGMGLYYVLKLTGDASPAVDAIVGASGIVGTVWLVRTYLENWIVWLFSDIVSTLLCLSQGLYWMMALYLVYTITAVIGWREWRSKAVYID